MFRMIRGAEEAECGSECGFGGQPLKGQGRGKQHLVVSDGRKRKKRPIAEPSVVW